MDCQGLSRIRVLTVGVPICMCDITGGAFTCSNSLGVQYTVDINKVIMGRNGQILA